MIRNKLAENFEQKTGLKFESFYRKYRPKLVWYLTRYTKDQEKAEDFADDAFTQSLLKIDNYDNEKSQIHTWIYKIGENLVKKDYKDRKRMLSFSLDGENNDNLSLINVLPHNNDQYDIEQELILDKKVDLVKQSIFNLPEKYKKVMIMRELENKPYLEIAELCTKDYKLSFKNDKKSLPSVTEFLEIFVNNNGNEECLITFTYEDKKEPTKVKISPGSSFKIDKNEVCGLSKLEIESKDYIEGVYRTTTNLSTIKSQISKGRQLIQSMVRKRFNSLDENGIK
ncbi:MAG: sigma-70 family RNA polymerase sigma factor [bacterium]